MRSRHNGNLVNARELRDELERDGSIFQTSSDTEVILHLLARVARGDARGRASSSRSSQVAGAFSLVMLTQDRLIAARDPHGFRPLALGRLGDAWVVVLRDLRARPDRRHLRARRRAGRGARRSAPTGCSRIQPFPPAQLAHCVFEHVYFARPDSYVFGQSVNEVRTDFGRVLAREAPVDADVVVPVPDSGVCAAIGFAEESGIPLRMGLIRNHYVGRTFIEPQQSIRHFGVRVKLNPVRSMLEGKRVVLVDDSIVRGTTSRKIVKMVQGRGRQGSAHAHQLPADHLAVLLRHRHAAARRADRRHAHARGDPQVPRRRHASATSVSRACCTPSATAASPTAPRATPASTRSRSRATSRRTCSSRSSGRRRRGRILILPAPDSGLRAPGRVGLLADLPWGQEPGVWSL